MFSILLKLKNNVDKGQLLNMPQKQVSIDKIGKQTFIAQCSVDKYPNLSMSCRVVREGNLKCLFKN